MPKTVSANEAKNRLDSLLGYVNEHGDEVIVERHGKPAAVIISMAAYEDVQAIREERRRDDLKESFRRLNERLAARTHDLSEDEALELSVQVSRAIIHKLATRGENYIEPNRPDHS